VSRGSATRLDIRRWVDGVDAIDMACPECANPVHSLRSDAANRGLLPLSGAEHLRSGRNR
jgi:hypothetical protein